MATPALIPIEEVITRYLLKYRKSTDDAFIYIEHAANCYREFRMFDSDQQVTSKVTITANKLIEMPADMVGFVDLFTPIGGELWSFTEKKYIVNTTTFTGLVEGRDSTVGEGVDITLPRTTGYAAVGGVNDYNYTIDWQARRIFIDGMDTATVILVYVSTGIEITGTTQVPDFLTNMIDNYLLWKETYWLPELVRERQARERDYINAKLSTRNFMYAMSYNSWHDLIVSGFIQAPQR
jgi:hypothetical protein